ncbi:hypothetical protein BDA96_08G068600 [Sorghum bicolor]|uniref:BHLH domain-containing protein n=1 Tax=Sorghum bicolor TaxID=4558 RepID=A0A921U7F9_SORBI|nr:hypothetical protein BDA96_08G068600 [Sorghum bicolor]KAG0520376.1 hypothetical protein BDA96_08G068600 [Sorghum bicolor]
MAQAQDQEHPLALSLPPPAKAKEEASPEPERARRRHMSRLYAELGAQLPGLPPRASRARILEDAIAYVGVLRATVAGLEARAAFAKAAATATATPAGAAEVVVAGKASCFAVRLPVARRRGALTRVLEVFRRHGVPVLAATVTSDGGEAAVTVTTAPVPPRFLQRIQEDIRSSIA